jgi:uncharacterized membrane protein YphA (DoxX/SURF4 family)
MSAIIIFILLFVFFAITFLQSGIDKIIDTEGNLGWFKSQFQSSFLAKIITPLFWLITVQELLCGGMMLIAIFNAIKALISFRSNHFFEYHADDVPFIFAIFILIQLFFGQRIAKDYVGASGIIPYILLAMISWTLAIFL